jgi:SagB-type dehydrogenase family enzyme
MVRTFAHGTADDPALGLSGNDPGEEYHEASKLHRATASQLLGPGGYFFHTEPNAEFRLGRKVLAHAGPGISLPEPPALPVDLAEVTRHRRSWLPDRTAPITATQVSGLLALTCGRSPARPDLRVTPSAGALYPLDVIVVVGEVAGIDAGGYVYDGERHRLLPRVGLDVPGLHSRAAVAGMIPDAAVTFAIVASFARSRVKYGARAYRFALLEAGHLAQGLVTVASALELASLPWGGYLDDEVDDALELDGRERSCVYLVSVSKAPADLP